MFGLVGTKRLSDGSMTASGQGCASGGMLCGWVMGNTNRPASMRWIDCFICYAPLCTTTSPVDLSSYDGDHMPAICVLSRMHLSCPELTTIEEAAT